MTTSPLLAKSYDRRRYPGLPPDYALLTQHSRDVAAACRALAACVGTTALEATGLEAAYLDRFTTTLLLNGWAQDLGKASSHFQKMVGAAPDIRQLVRHETISGLLLWCDLRRWLEPLGDGILLAAVWGALGHHRKFDDQTRPDPGAALTVHVAHADFAVILGEMAADLGLSPPPSFEHDFTMGCSKREGADRVAGPMINAMVDEFRDAEEAYRDHRPRRLLALVKGFGIAADVAASAVGRRGVSPAQYSVAGFVERELAQGLSVADLDALIRRWAWACHDSVPRDESRLPPGFKTRPFQDHVAESTSTLTLAEAGCGSGKSLAAYLWTRRWCERKAACGAGGIQLFFCLPTTGTTTEHFKDYALESGVPASLAHSRAGVDLHTLAETAAQEEAQGGSTAPSAALQALEAERQKIAALELWGTPLVVTTADTVLGLMANARRSLCALPAIVRSAIVFDEVHAFDDQLFGHLLVFLQNFPGLPVLLMTASLPMERRRALLDLRADLAIVPGPPDLEWLERYRLSDASDEAAWAEVDRCMGQGAKVLWVRNRVDWANRTYERARARWPGCPIDVYHSRFRYRDRSERHRRVIDRFKRAGEPALLVATQVAEMSLDLSADLLISDEAPISALIQRLGRLNRRATPENPGTPKPALVLPVGAGDELPYDEDALSASRTWRRSLAGLGRALTQRDLADQFGALGGGKDFDYAGAQADACFFGVPERSGIWRTRPGKTRGEGHTITVLLARDVARIRGDREAPGQDWLRAHEVAIPIRDAVIKWRRVAGLPVAPEDAISYDYDDSTREGTGARWQES